MKNVKIVKIGGNIVDKPEALEQFLDDFQIDGLTVAAAADEQEYFLMDAVRE